MAQTNTPFHPVTHVIFDMDGLLLDTERRYEKSIQQMCQKYGSEYTEEAKKHTMGRTARDSAEAVIKHCNLPISVDQFIEEVEELYKDVFAEYIPFLPGAEKLVKHLKVNNIPICIATSGKNSTFALKAKHHGEFFKLFHHIVRGSDEPEVQNGKPAPDIFLVAANRFDPPVAPKDALVFEDSINGVKAGLAAGMQVVWVPPPFMDKSEVPATLVIKSLEDFKPELFGLPRFEDDGTYYKLWPV